MSKKQQPVRASVRRLSAADVDGYHDLTAWIVVSDGEGVQPFATKAEAVAAAKEQADDIPNLVLGVYRLEHYVSARVQEAEVFAPTPEPANV